MKKIILLLLAIFMVSSCAKQEVEKKIEIIYIEKMRFVDIEREVEKIKYVDEYAIPTDFGQPMEKFDISSKFGFRKNPMGGIIKFDMHKGMDLVGPKNAKIFAVQDGTVVVSYPPPNGKFKGHPIYGGMLLLDHGKGIYTLYGHFKVTYVREKERVKKGQVIGIQGNTGISTGPHLHFEILIDPAYAFEGGGKNE